MPGSTTDTLARVLMDGLKERWRQTVIVDNVGRGGAMTGSIVAFNARPDGYSLFVTAPGPVTYSHLIYRGLKFDPTKFTPIAVLARAPNALMVRNGFPASTLAELIAYAKANPNGIRFASQGIATTPYLSAMLLETLADVKLRHVPYRGTPEATMDIVADRVDMFFGTAAAALPQYESGKLKVLAVGGAERMPQASSVPTMEEAGLPGFRSMTWYAIAAPPGLSDDLANKIHDDVQAVLRNPDVMRKLDALGLETMPGTRANASQFFAAETALWAKVIEAKGIQLDAE
jgi:tripartite-type tricarboxylate transporter receptor subunit TctC